MASTILYIVAGIIAFIFVVVSGSAAAFAASKLTSFLNNTNLAKAHQLLTIGAILGISTAVILIAIFITSFYAGGFTVKEVKEIALPGVEEKKSGSSGVPIAIISVLIILILISISVGLLASFAAANISNGGNTTAIDDAYIPAIVAAVTGFIGAILILAVLITYEAIRRARKKKIEENKKEVEMKNLVKNA